MKTPGAHDVRSFVGAPYITSYPNTRDGVEESGMCGKLAKYPEICFII
jgi:hypothetical protein